jgi:hypothetical protein
LSARIFFFPFRIFSTAFPNLKSRVESDLDGMWLPFTLFYAWFFIMLSKKEEKYSFFESVNDNNEDGEEGKAGNYSRLIANRFHSTRMPLKLIRYPTGILDNRK